ncbi:MAG: hypothetical protein R3A44_06280 [Caldilineaceae bacterium]
MARPVAAGLRRSAGPVAAKAEGRRPSKSRAVRSFIQTAPRCTPNSRPEVVEQAITQALAVGMAHLEGVTFCLHRQADPAPTLTLPSTTTRSQYSWRLQPLVVARYNQLFRRCTMSPRPSLTSVSWRTHRPMALRTQLTTLRLQAFVDE